MYEISSHIVYFARRDLSQFFCNSQPEDPGRISLANAPAPDMLNSTKTGTHWVVLDGKVRNGISRKEGVCVAMAEGLFF
jgi:hypothetical protein